MVHTLVVEDDQVTGKPDVAVAASWVRPAPKVTLAGAPVIVTVWLSAGLEKASLKAGCDGPTALVATTRILYEVP